MVTSSLNTYYIDLCVSSKLYDLTAKTAKTTLWEMGYKNLSSLSREICFSFDVLAEDNEEASSIIENIVKKTTLFVNPNKDTYKIRSQESGVRGQGSVIDVAIWYIDDKRPEFIRNSLKNQGWSKILNVSQGEIWHFSLSSGKEELVREMIDTFLVNPHSQKYCILMQCNANY
ncbi:MAG: hypothetical protein AB1630_08460 [bacterium]